jgi:hypothetical protein
MSGHTNLEDTGTEAVQRHEDQEPGETKAEREEEGKMLSLLYRVMHMAYNPGMGREGGWECQSGIRRTR